MANLLVYMNAAEDQLKRMGFTPESARMASREAMGDIDRAIEILAGKLDDEGVSVRTPYSLAPMI
ncbi:hypothetical protein BT69DRAFT_214672 [Atractiella rhizophila]|nr:hypothetical protein BT69DRAFT_214672 [Atractiella rhizophila]